MLLAFACKSSSEQAADRAGGATAEGTVADFVADRELERLSVKTEDGEILTFEIGDSIPAVAWNRRHLEAHKSSGQRMIVTFLEERGVLVATKLEEGGF